MLQVKRVWNGPGLIASASLLAWAFVLTIGLSPSTLIAAELPAVALLEAIAEHPQRSAPATALSLNQSVLSARIQAPVAELKVRVGQQVAAGDSLLQLDCTDFELAHAMAEASLTSAQARLTLARSQRERAQRLFKQQVTSQDALDTALAEAVAREAELQQAQLSLRQATLNQQRCDITAPFAGAITARLIGEGQLAAVGTPLLELVDLERMEVSALVKPDELKQLSANKELVFTTDANYPVRFSGGAPVINPATRTLDIRLQFTGARPAPGAAGQLRWHDTRYYIPSRFTVQREGKTGVFVARANKAVFVPLAGAIPGRAALTDLPADTLIVTSNLGSLQAGDAVAQP